MKIGCEDQKIQKDLPSRCILHWPDGTPYPLTTRKPQ